jgi:metallophosphoesterase superfamily enzyme
MQLYHTTNHARILRHQHPTSHEVLKRGHTSDLPCFARPPLRPPQ